MLLFLLYFFVLYLLFALSSFPFLCFSLFYASSSVLGPRILLSCVFYVCIAWAQDVRGSHFWGGCVVSGGIRARQYVAETDEWAHAYVRSGGGGFRSALRFGWVWIDREISIIVYLLQLPPLYCRPVRVEWTKLRGGAKPLKACTQRHPHHRRVGSESAPWVARR